MTRYTVTWVPNAQDELAQIWLDAPDRQAVTAATHRIDRELAEDAPTKGTEVSEGLRELIVPPLKVLFTASEADRLVVVAKVHFLRPPSTLTEGNGFIQPAE